MYLSREGRRLARKGNLMLMGAGGFRLPDTYCQGAYLCDHFTAPTGTTLTAHTMNVGSGWSVGQFGAGETWSIQSGTAKVDYANTDLNNACALADSGHGDGTLTMDVTVPAATSNCQLQIPFRWTDTNNHWIWIWDTHLSTNNVNFAKTVSGTFTPLATANFASPGAGTYTITIILSGSSLTAKIGNTTVNTNTDSANSTATKYGLGQFLFHSSAYDYVVAFDNFRFTA